MGGLGCVLCEAEKPSHKGTLEQRPEEGRILEERGPGWGKSASPGWRGNTHEPRGVCWGGGQGLAIIS